MTRNSVKLAMPFRINFPDGLFYGGPAPLKQLLLFSAQVSSHTTRHLQTPPLAISSSTISLRCCLTALLREVPIPLFTLASSSLLIGSTANAMSPL